MNTSHPVPGIALRAGVILELARRAGIQFRETGSKRPIRCPFHQDRHPSAFLDPATNVFYCSVCTPNGGWTAKRFAAELSAPWSPSTTFERPGRGHGETSQPTKHDPAFPPSLACEVWRIASARARDDDRVDADRAVYDFVAHRGIAESWEDGLFGVLSNGIDLPGPISKWPSSGHRLIAPLYNDEGEITNVQARTVGNGSPRTLFPRGSTAAGTLFASSSGVEVLRGCWSGTKRVIFGEGLTDYLALATVSPVPILCAPGTSMAAGGIGRWVAGFEVLLALDWDEAGDNATAPTASRARGYGATRVRRLEWPAYCNDACNVVDHVGIEGLAAFLDRILGGTA